MNHLIVFMMALGIALLAAIMKVAVFKSGTSEVFATIATCMAAFYFGRWVKRHLT